jgi:hypothetical protein
MMTNRNSAIAEKRDLHVGGLGSSASVGLRMIEPWDGAATARNAANEADDYIRDNTWTAIGVVALIGLAAGYFLSRRS